MALPPYGNALLSERDVFLKDTAPHNTWRFYREQTSDRILAYAIELTGTERGKIKGNLYELDYTRHYERVKDKELAANTVRLIYEHGTRDIPAGQYFAGNPDTLYGKFERFEAIPNDPDALRFLLQEESIAESSLRRGFKAHIAVLHDGLLETEARRIVAGNEAARHAEQPQQDPFHGRAFQRIYAACEQQRFRPPFFYAAISDTFLFQNRGQTRDVCTD